MQVGGRQDAALAEQAVGLDPERDEGDEEDRAEQADEEPRAQPVLGGEPGERAAGR